MCGIVGFVSDALGETELKKMCGCLRHRGPDADGYFVRNNIGLGHRRLSIIDLSEAANQPMHSGDGEWIIVFNGEIYNYTELKKELIEKGCIFKTNSDTEVVLQSFQLYGTNAVHRFIGMFAFAIYHRTSEKLYLFRDRIGVKPLYYYWKNGEFYFASELKALIPQLPRRAINPKALTDFFCFGYVRNPDSIFEDTYKLRPGHYAIVKDKQLQIVKYWDIEDHIFKQQQINEKDLAFELEELMRNCFNYRMVADVPVGIFLSGGIDSSSLTALLSKTYSNLKTFSIGFDDERYNEAGHAKKIANYLGTNHHEQILTASDAEKVLGLYFSIYDEPFADSSGIPVYLVSQFAKENGCKVVLSADGGDELFGGYDRYLRVPMLLRRLRKAKMMYNSMGPIFEIMQRMPIHRANLQHRANKLSDLYKNTGDEIDFYTSYLSIVPSRLLGKIIKSNEAVPQRFDSKHNSSFEERMMLWDLKNYLPENLLTKVDRASMATSIEAREPFLDHRLVEFVFSLPQSLRLSRKSSKYLLKEVLFRYIPSSYFERKKMGFSIPLFTWFSQRLDKDFEEVFSEQNLKNIDVLNKNVIVEEYRKYKKFKENGKEYNMLLMWHIYVFVKWWKQWNCSNSESPSISYDTSHVG
jgi:asparagine synthase (glutamine-hydrolysing)